MRLGRVWLLIALGVGGCLPPPRAVDDKEVSVDGGVATTGGVVVTPTRGQLFEHASETSFVVRGLAVEPSLPLAVLRLAPDGSEQVIATGTSDASDHGDGYLFGVRVPALRDAWPAGGLVRLRVVDGRGRHVGVMERDDRPCLSCGVDAPLTLVSAPALDRVDGASRYLDLKGRASVEDTQRYYAVADLPESLDDFKARYFADADDEAVAVYYNAGDLAIGRELHCASFPTAAGRGRACYVANYGQFSEDAPLAFDLATKGAATATHDGSFATVAMVYRPPVDAPNAVSFVVYSSTGSRLVQAQLDRLGDNDTVPANCLNCHGGSSTYDAARGEVRNARFLPIDPGAVKFLRADGYGEVDQAEGVRRLNAHIAEAGLTPSARALVERWYAPEGLSAPGARPRRENGLPAEWDVSPLARAAYRDAIAPACRSCHLSMTDGRDGRAALDFADAASTLAAGPRIVRALCGAADLPPARRMPSCEVAAHSFWSGPGRAALLDFVGDRGACAPSAP